jgi:OOP family OmpA-OmpF porin
MKFFYFTTLLLVLLNPKLNYSQTNLNSSSFEIGYGYNGAIIPYSGNNSNLSVSNMNHINVAFRYMFTEKVGLKLFYKSDNFVNFSKGRLGISYKTIGTSIVYNVGKELGLNFITRDKFSVLTHIDGGVAFAFIKQKNNFEKLGVIGVGITPIYSLTNKLAITTDLTYNTTLKQHYGFDGVLLSSNYEPKSRNFYNFSLGLIIYLGENSYHSDWY